MNQRHGMAYGDLLAVRKKVIPDCSKYHEWKDKCFMYVIVFVKMIGINKEIYDIICLFDV